MTMQNGIERLADSLMVKIFGKIEGRAISRAAIIRQMRTVRASAFQVAWTLAKEYPNAWELDHEEMTTPTGWVCGASNCIASAIKQQAENGDELDELLTAAREEGRREAAPEGWKLVPVEPTVKILKALGSLFAFPAVRIAAMRRDWEACADNLAWTDPSADPKVPTPWFTQSGDRAKRIVWMVRTGTELPA